MNQWKIWIDSLPTSLLPFIKVLCPMTSPNFIPSRETPIGEIARINKHLLARSVHWGKKYEGRVVYNRGIRKANGRTGINLLGMSTLRFQAGGAAMVNGLRVDATCLWIEQGFLYPRTPNTFPQPTHYCPQAIQTQRVHIRKNLVPVSTFTFQTAWQNSWMGWWVSLDRESLDFPIDTKHQPIDDCSQIAWNLRVLIETRIVLLHLLACLLPLS